MSHILRKLQTTPTGNIAIGSFDRMPVCSAVKVSIEPTNNPTLEEYRAEIRIGTTFICNSAQYDLALRNAEKGLIRHLYKDIHEIIYELRSALYAESLEEMSEAINKLESCIR